MLSSQALDVSFHGSIVHRELASPLPRGLTDLLVTMVKSLATTWSMTFQSLVPANPRSYT
ncbi:conserved hypothetical protein [Thiomonas arsenitoxydans]|uniref:Uncharacterized protein n=1 Tax=Thiomonas arsenitoxydans (strain DSM 22701 / CIP 110005 / 3As) TaxID=426114 RepID=D6CS91_THIA3|nr:Hypothetical protein THI_0915 [Thiomonas arsenitoxydans]CQR26961.1 conserved hypothetical protein [Thiomonas arsenitoxydans]CQR30181.1 conserved hypothetical protein [Thiomonas arsenitoxydans]CQR32377.1 conserved hypothetical protein [Thiomonas arsenitoxydans]